MLEELRVSNFAIIEQLKLSLTPGLNIISGETGAGKSVLIKSLSLLMGEKASSDFLWSQDKEAIVEGVFDLSHRQDILLKLTQLGISIEDEVLLVQRSFNSQGKNRVYLNGHLSTLQHLRTLVSPLIEMTSMNEPLIEITAQHESRHLLSRSYHMDLLDRFAQLLPQREIYFKKREEYLLIQEKIKEIFENEKTRNQRLDFLKYQIDEIESLGLEVNENLEEAVLHLKNSEQVLNFCAETENILYSNDHSLVSTLKEMIRKSKEISLKFPFFKSAIETLEPLTVILEDFAFDISQKAKKFQFDSQKLEVAEKRLSDFRKLQKKFGETIEEILSALSEMKEELSQLQNSEIEMVELNHQASLANDELIKLSDQLHFQREKEAKKLVQRVNHELSELNMKGVLFLIDIQTVNEFTSTGRTQVEFMIQTKGKEPKSLTKFASGGELSRILLSLKHIAGKGLLPRTFLFDEVDTGVSGRTAELLGRKLKNIAQSGQVICVTHLPQVASFASTHFRIEKSVRHNGIQMHVKKLDSKDRVKEVARLISGETITQTSLDHAQNLILTSQK